MSQRRLKLHAVRVLCTTRIVVYHIVCILIFGRFIFVNFVNQQFFANVTDENLLVSEALMAAMTAPTLSRGDILNSWYPVVGIMLQGLGMSLQRARPGGM